MHRPRRATLILVLASTLACKSTEKDDAKQDAKAGAEADAKAADGGAEAGAGEDAKAAEGGAEAGAGEDGQQDAGTAGETEAETGEELPPAPDTFEKVGVEICDQYVADYVACIDAKAPEAERDEQRRLLNVNVQAWTQMASGGPSAEKGLQTACRIAREQAKRVTADWGCEW